MTQRTLIHLVFLGLTLSWGLAPAASLKVRGHNPLATRIVAQVTKDEVSLSQAIERARKSFPGRLLHGETQRRAAERAARAVEEARGGAVATDLEDFTGFTLAEDYHQKYRLRADREVLVQYLALYPTTEAFLASTAVTRANAFAGGHGDAALVAEDLPRMGLSGSAQEGLRRRVIR